MNTNINANTNSNRNVKRNSNTNSNSNITIDEKVTQATLQAYSFRKPGNTYDVEDENILHCFGLEAKEYVFKTNITTEDRYNTKEDCYIVLIWNNHFFRRYEFEGKTITDGRLTSVEWISKFYKKLLLGEIVPVTDDVKRNEMLAEGREWFNGSDERLQKLANAVYTIGQIGQIPPGTNEDKLVMVESMAFCVVL